MYVFYSGKEINVLTQEKKSLFYHYTKFQLSAKTVWADCRNSDLVKQCLTIDYDKQWLNRISAIGHMFPKISKFDFPVSFKIFTYIANKKFF